MGKNKKRKRHALFHAAVSERTRVTTTRSEDQEEIIISEEDLEITIQTLETITQHEHFLQSKACKQLRRILHPLILRQMQSYERIDYGARVTQFLSNQKWADASIALQGAIDFSQRPKPGTVQRWVKDCDQAGGDYKMKLLSAIIRLTGDSSSKNKHDAGQVLVDQLNTPNDDHELLTFLPGWKIPGDEENNQQGQHQTLEASSITLNSRIIYREDAADRKPPNKYDLLLHTTAPGSIHWNPSPKQVMKVNVPFIPNALVLTNVLSRNECLQLRDAATKLGFRPDHPISSNKPTGIDSCEWLVDESIRSVVFDRVKAHLPSNMAGGDHVLHSINPRWRFFRYSQDCVYRPHLDGSWPESRINAHTGEYESSDDSGNVKSFLTFLIYLNDDFLGGETRFYLPASNGMMTARGVIPKMGAVLVFPQANTASLIHEGSAVTDGCKLVVRTDVMYHVSTE